MWQKVEVTIPHRSRDALMFKTSLCPARYLLNGWDGRNRTFVLGFKDHCPTVGRHPNIWRKRWVTIPLGVAPGLRLATGRDSYLPLFLNMENRVGFEPTVGFLLRLKRPLHSANFATGPNMVGVMGVEPTASQFQTEDATVTPHPVKW